MEFKVIKRNKETYLSTFFIDLEGLGLCLRTREGSKPRSSGYKLTFDWLCVLLVLKKVLK